MRKIARLAVAFALSASVLLLPATAMAAPQLDLLTTTSAAITAGSESWVLLNWTSSETVTNFHAEVSNLPAGVTVGYPSNLGSWTGLMNGHELAGSEIDFSAVRIAVPADFGSDSFKIDVLVSYQVDGRVTNHRFKVKVPVAIFSGQAVSYLSGDATIPSGSGGWANLSFAGHAPTSSDFSLVVTDASGLTVMYPSDREATSLRRDSVLSAGETDSAAVYFDTTLMGAGGYIVSFTATYGDGTGTTSIDGTATITVSP